MKFGREDYNKRIIDLEKRIPEDEPVFFLRGSDKLAPELLLLWASKLRLNGGDPNMARNAENHAQAMLDWQKIHGVKTPDLYKESQELKIIKDKILSILNSGDNSQIKILSKLIKEYCSGNEELLILMRSDIKIEFKNFSIDELELDHFNIDELDLLRKVIVFCDNTKFKTLKCKL